MLPETVSIAVIEDDPIMGESLNQYLELEGCKVEWWRSGQEALAGLRRGAPDLVICDIRLPDMSGEDIFRTVSSESAAPPFLFMTAYGQIDHAVSLIRAGAGDYVTKPFELDDLISRARALISRRPTVSNGILGLSHQMRRIEMLLGRVAGRNTPVLFTGETGSGKEVCARHLHCISDAASRPFVAVNCAAIPDNLLESEVFGHEKGAFTGANSRHLGYAERAQSGTLFLDEVAELPLQLQAKLLRLLDERRFYRLGGEAVVPFRARVVCATNRDLATEVAAGRFREDLYYRINVVTVAIPPLRERPEDIQLLMHRFFTELAIENPDLRGLSSGAEATALAHRWPGNVRELRNRLDRAIALATGPWLMPLDLFPEIVRSGSLPSGRSLAAARDAAEQQEIERALKETNGQIAEAAKLLGVSRTTLWERMRRFGINAV
jgi:DNA-binding NtrC family response regulator